MQQSSKYQLNEMGLNAMQAYGGRRGPAPLILNLSTSWSRQLYHEERKPVPSELEAGWAPKQVWTFWRREKSFALNGTRTPLPSSTYPTQCIDYDTQAPYLKTHRLIKTFT
jgi:hypothetical protein